MNGLNELREQGIWVNRPAWHQAMVFIDIGGESLAGAVSGAAVSL